MGKLTVNRNIIGVAIMGYGIVGKGVAHVIRHNAGYIEKRTGLKINLLHILDILDFPDSIDASIITHDVFDILRDDSVHIVVETMGGIKTAYDYTKKAFTSGKHVVTSNKELVAEYGPELLALAERHGVDYMFDASVGGGIPAITPIRECLAANDIQEICGILNGTTNFILTHMREQGARFDAALRLAQTKGYAEKNPEADIEGGDACRKLAILASIAWDAFLDWKTVHSEGIANVTLEDIIRASDLGCALKLVARVRRRDDNRFEAYVLPAMIDKRDPLSNVKGVNNAILVRGDLTGDVILYGQGAGMLPTGSAIVSDIIKAACETRMFTDDSQSAITPLNDKSQSGDESQSSDESQFDEKSQGSDISRFGERSQGNDKPQFGERSQGNDKLRLLCSNPIWDRTAALEIADFPTYVHGYYARVETPDTDAYRDSLFREFPLARMLPRFETDKPTCAFIVPPLAENEFAGGLARANKRVAGSGALFVARMFKTP